MNTLAQINEYFSAQAPRTDTYRGLVTQTVAAVGMQGHARSGAKQHLLFGDRVVEILDSPAGQRNAARRIRVGSVVDMTAFCVMGANMTATRIGSANRSADTANITCTKCLTATSLTRDLGAEVVR